jgi:rhamnosyltransferase
MTSPTIGVAVITHKSVKLLPNSLPPLLASPLKPRILVVNSSSGDGTVELAREMGAETLVIPRPSFNHGLTRELARKHLGTDIVVMITPDAICVSPDTITHLVKPLVEGKAAMSYARQLPHEGAGFFEAFSRRYNYRDQSEIRGIADLERMGPRLYFCSDSLAAWSNAALDAIGGFEHTLSLEDTLAAAKLLHAGYKTAHCADALVKHSHFYPVVPEFRHYFDVGYVRGKNRDVLLAKGSDEKLGAGMVSSMLKELLVSKPWLIPYAVLLTASKYLGYRAGFMSSRAAWPASVMGRLSSQDYYWNPLKETAAP